MKFKRRLAILLATFMLFMMIPTEIRAVDSENVVNTGVYEFNLSTGTIVRYLGQENDVIIPSFINGVSVKNIGTEAFSGYVGYGKIKRITIPESIENINDTAISLQLYLEEIIVDEDNENYCSVNGVLFDKRMEKIFHYPIQKEGTEYIIPDSVKVIGIQCFYRSTLESIKMSDNVECIEFQAFSQCHNLNNINLSKNLKIIKNDAFSYCLNLKSINIPDSVEEIEKWAFAGCKSLIKVKLPQSIKKISENLFSNCSELKYVEIPSNVEVIDRYAFFACRNLEGINIQIM